MEHFFNKKKEQKPLGPRNLKSNVKEQIGNPNLSSTKSKVTKPIGNPVKDDNPDSRISSSVTGDFYVFFSFIMYLYTHMIR